VLKSVSRPGYEPGKTDNTKRTVNIIKEALLVRRYGAVNIRHININRNIGILIRSM